MISLDKCTGRCNVLSPNIYVFQRNLMLKKCINVKAFNIIANKNEAKIMAKHISCDLKCKLNKTTFNSNKNVTMKHVNVNVKITVSAKKIIAGILAHVFVRITSTLKKVLLIFQ